MLKGISPILTPELLKILAEMGHSDELVIGDCNFPATSMGKRCARQDGQNADDLLDAILQLFPLDTFVDAPVTLMRVAPGTLEGDPPIWERFHAIVEKHQPDTQFETIDRFEFYERAKNAYAVDYLYGLGHRDIGYLKFGLPVHNCQERYRGYVERMRELGLPLPEPCVLASTLNVVYEALKLALKEGRFQPHTAFVADNDSVAIGALKALTEAGYRVPEDFSIVGVDDIPFSAVSTPALTTMRISQSTLGSLAVQALRTRIKNPGWPAMHLQVDGQLIERNSCRRV